MGVSSSVMAGLLIFSLGGEETVVGGAELSLTGDAALTSSEIEGLAVVG